RQERRGAAARQAGRGLADVLQGRQRRRLTPHAEHQRPAQVDHRRALRPGKHEQSVAKHRDHPDYKAFAGALVALLENGQASLDVHQFQ
ncbi:hypothetical protein PR002_g33234, partial [Phytophthora rubi]